MKRRQKSQTEKTDGEEKTKYRKRRKVRTLVGNKKRGDRYVEKYFYFEKS